MQFNPDPGKQANSYFLSKTKTTFLFPLLKSIPLPLLTECLHQKHLGIDWIQN